MSFKKTLILLLVLVGFGFYIYKVELPKEEIAKQKDKLFADLSSKQIARIEISKQGKAFTIVNTAPQSGAQVGSEDDPFLRVSAEESKNWRIEGIADGANLDFGALNAFITALLDFNVDQEVPKDEVGDDLASFGLAKPELIIDLLAGDRSKRLIFGKRSEFLGKRYVRLDNEGRLVLMPEEKFDALFKDREFFRNKMLISFLDSELSEIQLKRPDSGLSFRRSPEGKWRIASPIDAEAADAAISDLTTQIRALKVDEFKDGITEEGVGLNAPDLTARLTFRESLGRQPLEVRIKRAPTSVSDAEPKAPAVYFAISSQPGVYASNIEPVDRIFKPVEEFREKRFFAFSADDVVHVSFERPGSPLFTLVKQGEEWSVNGKLGDRPFVEEIVRSLAGLQADGFPTEEKDYGFDAPRAKFAISLKGETIVGTPTAQENTTSRTHVLTIGAPANRDQNNPGYFARGSDKEQVFVVSEKTLQKITPREETLIKRNESTKQEDAQTSVASPPTAQ